MSGFDGRRQIVHEHGSLPFDIESDTPPDRADRVMKAMMTMKKIDIQRLKDAYEGR